MTSGRRRMLAGALALPLLAGLLLAAVFGPGASGSAVARAKAGKASLASGMGSAVPNRGGVAVVTIRCSGPSGARCEGRVRLLPRGRTRGQLGRAALASGSFKLASARHLSVPVRLTKRARTALGRGTLAVTIELSAAGKRTPARRPALLALPKPFRVHKAPRVRVEHPPGGGTATFKVYSWAWDIPAGSYLNLPAFTCPAVAPRVAADGKFIADNRNYGNEGKVEVSAKEGTGYSTFMWGTYEAWRNEGGHTNYSLSGWRGGTWEGNSIWAPLNDSGHFDLKVTCTDLPRTEAAYAFFNQAKAMVFPWVNNDL